MCGGAEGSAQAAPPPAYYGRRFNRSSVLGLSDADLNATRIDTMNDGANAVRAGSQYSNGRLAAGTYFTDSGNYLVSDGRSIQRFTENDSGQFGARFGGGNYANSFYSVEGRSGSPANSRADNISPYLGNRVTAQNNQTNSTRRARRTSFSIGGNTGVNTGGSSGGSGLAIPV